MGRVEKMDKWVGRTDGGLDGWMDGWMAGLSCSSLFWESWQLHFGRPGEMLAPRRCQQQPLLPQRGCEQGWCCPLHPLGCCALKKKSKKPQPIPVFPSAGRWEPWDSLLGDFGAISGRIGVSLGAKGRAKPGHGREPGAARGSGEAESSKSSKALAS